MQQNRQIDSNLKNPYSGVKFPKIKTLTRVKININRYIYSFFYNKPIVAIETKAKYGGLTKAPSVMVVVISKVIDLLWGTTSSS